MTSRLKFIGSDELSEYPDILWDETYDRDRCHYALWEGGALSAEVAHCQLTNKDYSYVPEKMFLDQRLPESFKYIEENQASLMWSDSETLYGKQGQVVVRYFTLTDESEKSCVGFDTIFGRSQTWKDNIVIGYLCAEKPTLSLKDMVPKQLHALSVVGHLDHVVEAP